MAKKTRPRKIKGTTKVLKNDTDKKRWGYHLNLYKIKEKNVRPVYALVVDAMIKYRDIDHYLELDDAIYFSVFKKDVREHIIDMVGDTTYAQIDKVIYDIEKEGYIKIAISHYIYNGIRCNRPFYNFTDKTKELVYDIEETFDF